MTTDTCSGCGGPKAATDWACLKCVAGFEATFAQPAPTVMVPAGLDLVEVVRRAPAGTVLELVGSLSGEWDGTDFCLTETLYVQRDLTIRGRKPDGTTACIGSTAGGALLVLEAGRLHLDKVILRHDGGKSADVLVATGGVLEAHGLQCRAGRAGKKAGAPGGSGVWVTGTAVARFEYCEINRNQGAGMRFDGACTVEASIGEANQNGGVGMVVAGDATVTVEAMHHSNNKAHGLCVQDRAKVTIRTAGLVRNKACGLVVEGLAVCAVSDSMIANNAEHGVRVTGQPQVRLDRCKVGGNKGFGLSVEGEAVVEDVGTTYPKNVLGPRQVESYT